MGLQDHWVVLKGTNLVWYVNKEEAHTDGAIPKGQIKLDVKDKELWEKVRLDDKLPKVALLPGWVMKARTQRECNEWLLAITFNLHAAQLAGDKEWGDTLEKVSRAPQPIAEELMNDSWHHNGTRDKGSNRRFDANYNHPCRDGRLTLSLELMQGGKPDKDDKKANQLYSSLGEAEKTPPHLRIYLGLPEGVSSQLDRSSARDQIRNSRKDSGGVASSGGGGGRGRCHWVPMSQTEPRLASMVAPGRNAVSFAVMPSTDVHVDISDGPSIVRVAPETVRVRFDLCVGDTVLGCTACALSELQEAIGGRLVRSLVVDESQIYLSGGGAGGEAWGAAGVADLGRSNRFVSVPNYKAAYGEEEKGVQLGVSVYQLMPQPSEGAGHDVCTQSYMVPVRGELSPRTTLPNFNARALRCPEVNNAVIATEHLLLPRSSLDVPAAFLEQRVGELRMELRDGLAKVGIVAPTESERPPDGLEPEPTDDLDHEEDSEQDLSRLSPRDCLLGKVTEEGDEDEEGDVDEEGDADDDDAFDINDGPASFASGLPGLPDLHPDLVAQLGGASLSSFRGSVDSASAAEAADSDDIDPDPPSMQMVQMQLRRFLDAGPWYDRTRSFYQMMAQQHGSDYSQQGRRDLFFRCSKFKKNKEWAFVPINLMLYTLTIDETQAGAPLTTDEVRPAPF
eukprot:COSAG05_NODE_378_length_10601_cov_10.955437_2_plen_677_part_00